MKSQICLACPTKVVRTEVVDVDVVAKVMVGGLQAEKLEEIAQAAYKERCQDSASTENRLCRKRALSGSKTGAFGGRFQRRSHAPLRAPLTRSRGTRPPSLRVPGF
jgi:hypothetical protein